MSIAYRFQPISIEDYLQGELVSEVRHEYVDGEVFALVGARLKHNRIGKNVLRSLGNQLEGKPCEEFGPDTKIKVEAFGKTRFYYPDVSVICESNPETELFVEKPVVIVEVLSESTRRSDLGEKEDAYLTIPSLTHYIVLEQDAVAAKVFRRDGDDFASQEYFSLDDRIPLESIGAELALAKAYANVFD